MAFCAILPLLAALFMSLFYRPARRSHPWVFSAHPNERRRDSRNQLPPRKPISWIYRRVDLPGCALCFTGIIGVMLAIRLNHWPLSLIYLVPGAVCMLAFILWQLPSIRNRGKFRKAFTAPPIIPGKISQRNGY